MVLALIADDKIENEVPATPILMLDGEVKDTDPEPPTLVASDAVSFIFLAFMVIVPFGQLISRFPSWSILKISMLSLVKSIGLPISPINSFVTASSPAIAVL